MPLPRILLVTSELFPEFGRPTAGGGVRAQQLFRSLQGRGFQIDLALARETAEGCDLPDWATRFLYRQPYLDGVIEQADPDVVISESWECLSHLRFTDNRIYMADCPGPLILENLLGQDPQLRELVHHKIRTLAKLDAVFCPTSRMRSYLSGFLTLAGWSPLDSAHLVEVPISLPESLPAWAERPRSEEGLRIFAGGIAWSWHRSGEWLKTLADLVSEEGQGTVEVRMGPHPLLRSKSSETEDLSSDLRSHPHLRFSDLTDFDTLIEDLSRMDLAIEWSPAHFEREIASPFRIVTYLWSGLPVIVRPHLEIASWIERYDAGWVVENWEEVRAILKSVGNTPDLLRAKSEGAQKLARERHTWPEGHTALFELLENLSPRVKHPSFLDHSAQTFSAYEAELVERRNAYDSMKDEFGRMTARLAEAEKDAEAYRSLRQKPIYRIWKRILG